MGCSERGIGGLPLEWGPGNSARLGRRGQEAVNCIFLSSFNEILTPPAWISVLLVGGAQWFSVGRMKGEQMNNLMSISLLSP